MAFFCRINFCQIRKKELASIEPCGVLDLVKLACTHEELTSMGDLAREPVKHQKFSLTVLKDT